MIELERQDVTDILGELFEAHGFPVTREEDGLVLDGEGVRARATIFWQPTRSPIAQLDVWLEPWPGAAVCESIAGWGSTRDDAIRDAFEAFTRGVFHVLLRAFVDPRTEDDEVGQGELTLVNRTYELVQGMLLTRGPGESLHEWVGERFLDRVEEQALDGDVHWIRFSYSQMDGERLNVEVLLDNEPWPAMQEAMAREELPRADDYLSLRFFAVLLSRTLPVPRAAAILAADSDCEAIELARRLVMRGAEPKDALRLLSFLPAAAARATLATKGVRLPSEAYWYRGPDRDPEPFRLMDEPLYAAAHEYVAACISRGPRSLVESLASRSPELRAVNEALTRGVRPDELEKAVAVFIHPDGSD